MDSLSELVDDLAAAVESSDPSALGFGSTGQEVFCDTRRSLSDDFKPIVAVFFEGPPGFCGGEEY